MSQSGSYLAPNSMRISVGQGIAGNLHDHISERFDSHLTGKIQEVLLNLHVRE